MVLGVVECWVWMATWLVIPLVMGECVVWVGRPVVGRGELCGLDLGRMPGYC